MKVEEQITMEKHTKQIQSYKTGIDELCKIIARQNDKIEKLEKEVKKFQPYIVEKRLELKLWKCLALTGKIYVKSYTRDCDGVENCSNYEFESIDDYNEAYESWCDIIEGRCSWEVVPKGELHAEEDTGTYGHGWDVT